MEIKKTETSKFAPQGRVKTVNGTILSPESSGLRMILSVNNTKGKPEGNPLLPVFDKKWSKVRVQTKSWYATKTGAYKLGAVLETPVQSDVWIMNMLCQGDDLKVDLKGLDVCLKQVCKMALEEKASVCCSSVLTDLVPELKNMVVEQLAGKGVSVSFYNEP